MFLSSNINTGSAGVSFAISVFSSSNDNISSAFFSSSTLSPASFKKSVSKYSLFSELLLDFEY